MLHITCLQLLRLVIVQQLYFSLCSACNPAYPYTLNNKYFRFYSLLTDQTIILSAFTGTGGCTSGILSLDTGSTKPPEFNVVFQNAGSLDPSLTLSLSPSPASSRDPFAVLITFESVEASFFFTIMVWPSFQSSFGTTFCDNFTSCLCP